MSLTEIASLVGIICTAIGAVTAIFKLVHDMETRVNDNFAIVWRRFDEHKKIIDEKLEKTGNLIENKYLRIDVYKDSHMHLKETLDAQYRSLNELLDQRLRAIELSISEIKLCGKIENHKS